MTSPTHHDRELALVERALLGDPAAVSNLTRRLADVPAIVRHKNRRLGGPLDADEELEAAQDAVAAVWSKLAGYRGRSRLSTWIFGFASTQVVKAVQAKRRRRLVPVGAAVDDVPAPERPRASGETCRALHAALERLDPGSAAVVRLRHFEALAFEEIAERMRINLSTAKARYYRSLARLQAGLERLRDATRA